MCWYYNSLLLPDSELFSSEHSCMLSNPDIVFVSKYTSALHFRVCQMLMRNRISEQTLFKSWCFESLLRGTDWQFGTRVLKSKRKAPGRRNCRDLIGIPGGPSVLLVYEGEVLAFIYSFIQSASPPGGGFQIWTSQWRLNLSPAANDWMGVRCAIQLTLNAFPKGAVRPSELHTSQFHIKWHS